MIHPILQRKLTEIIEARHALRLRWANAAVLIIAALGIIVWPMMFGLATISFFKLSGFILAVGIIGEFIARKIAAGQRADAATLVREIEAHHPELNARLRTAIEQEPKGGGFTYLQQRVIDEAVTAAARSMWADEMTEADLKRAKRYGLAAIVLVFAAFSAVMQLHQNAERAKAPDIVRA